MARGVLNQVSVLAVVPARGGSVGVPRKNLRQIAGLSLIARAARVIGELPWIDLAVISSDDGEMREEGVKHGLQAPFERPAHLADSTASGPDVLKHAWLACETHYERQFDCALYLEPTSPLRRPDDVERTMLAMIEGGYDSAATVSRSPGHYTPEKCLLVDTDGRLRFFLPEGRSIHARQQIPPRYHRNGIAYAVRRNFLMKSGKVLGDNTVAIVIDRPVANIDDPIELEFAEWLLSRESQGER